MRQSHLTAIDADAWPGVAWVPTGRIIGIRARLAEASFARACADAGLDLDINGSPDLIVEEEELFSRIAISGWLGLAEGYLAGEWRAEKLADVLEALLRSDYHPRVPLGHRKMSPRRFQGGELPADLVRLSSGDGMSAFGGVFASGVPTTVRTAVPSFVSGHKGPQTHFVDLTTFSDPVAAERDDLRDAQDRSVEMLLDAARVSAGTHLLEYPGTGGSIAIGATHRRATVDTLTADPDYARAVEERLTLAGVAESVQTSVIARPIPGPREWRGNYDAIVSVERLEVLSARERVVLIRSLDRLLTIGGLAAIQTVVATDSMTQAAQASLGVLSAYIWPGLNYPGAQDIHRLADRESGLRIIGQTHVGNHAKISLGMQRSIFDGQTREAAAAGFDPVFRRLWDYQFALREALFRLGMLDVVQFTLTHRDRRGRR
ncbi:class I SAM-dependent methyltransferase [Corynebacterium alimapuense]|uniref:SAM-dependent methyltransferase n=1 Tax=Corynebacterium alimapuense TaxID=1576874 RepID=A0A3M8K8C7_9CORY|nr:class I SAM-dependent methyltransferase [Corynebacterium alimapuense]RNE49129.1 SAM-dependent methyltransferase [Corynebacterium alimapuense]